MSEDFKVLDDRSHVLLRPGMYLGAVVSEGQRGIINYVYQNKNIVPALIKMVDEIINNSVDEHVRTSYEYAQNIDIDISPSLDGTIVTIKDDGRGIPLDLIDGKPRAVLAWTSLRAGSNFSDEKRLGAGTNGVGSALTNIFSTSFVGKTCDGTKGIVVRCSDNMSTITHAKIDQKIRGTTVEFIPDLEKFGLTEFTQDHIDVLRDRISNLSIMYPTINFTFCKQQIKFKNIKQVAKNFHPSSISYEEKNISMVFAPSGEDEEFRCLSYLNGIYIKNGGTHVDYVIDKVITNLREVIQKKHKINVLPNQIKQHLLFASWVSNFNGPKFDSQTKERLTNSQAEVSAFLGHIDFDKIAKQILNTPEIVDPMIAAILFKKELAENLVLAKKQKALSKTRIVNHIAATDKNIENRTLFITEGLSALNGIISTRNPTTTGGFSLRGKPVNVRGMRPIEILKNKEIFELLTVIGLEFGKPATDLNYGRIAIMTDADVDGAAIFCLLLNLFSHWPELFHEKRIVKTVTPLYHCAKGKRTKVFYTKAEFDSFDSSGFDVSYFKGIGSLSTELYSECINNPKLVQIEYPEGSSEKLEMCFGDDASKRKNWMIG